MDSATQGAGRAQRGVHAEGRAGLTGVDGRAGAQAACFLNPDPLWKVTEAPARLTSCLSLPAPKSPIGLHHLPHLPGGSSLPSLRPLPAKCGACPNPAGLLGPGQGGHLRWWPGANTVWQRGLEGLFFSSLASLEESVPMGGGGTGQPELPVTSGREQGARCTGSPQRHRESRR